MANDWKIDGTINATEICEQAGWHYATAIEGLVSAGLCLRDAEAFASFVFADRAGRGADRRPEECVDDDQWARLS